MSISSQSVDTLLHQLKYLSFFDIINLRSISKEMYNLFNQDELWFYFIKRFREYYEIYSSKILHEILGTFRLYCIEMRIFDPMYPLTIRYYDAYVIKTESGWETTSNVSRVVKLLEPHILQRHSIQFKTIGPNQNFDSPLLMNKRRIIYREREIWNGESNEPGWVIIIPLGEIYPRKNFKDKRYFS